MHTYIVTVFYLKLFTNDNLQPFKSLDVFVVLLFGGSTIQLKNFIFQLHIICTRFFLTELVTFKLFTRQTGK